jgi:hypothetical protein
MNAKISIVPGAAVKPKFDFGTQLAAFGRSLGGVSIEIRRDPTPVKPAKFA